MPTDMSDVRVRLGRELSSAETYRATGLLPEAEALVRGYLGAAYPDGPLPSVIRIVESRMVKRVLESPNVEGVASQQGSWGPYQSTTTVTPEAAQASPWLSKSDRLMLASLRPNCVSVGLVSDRYVTSTEESGS